MNVLKYYDLARFGSSKVNFIRKTTKHDQKHNQQKYKYPTFFQFDYKRVFI